MAKITKTWLSRERNIIFLRNKKILNLRLKWHILREYCFIVEFTFTDIVCAKTRKMKVWSFFAFLIAIILSWFPYLAIAFKVGWNMLLVNRSTFCYLKIVNFFPVHKNKNELKISVFLLSYVTIFSPSIVVILLCDFILFYSMGLKVFQSCLLATSFSSKIE